MNLAHLRDRLDDFFAGLGGYKRRKQQGRQQGEDADNHKCLQQCEGRPSALSHPYPFRKIAYVR